MKYAIIESGAKQYRVSEGDVIDIELVQSNDKSRTIIPPARSGGLLVRDKHIFENVLLTADGEDVKIGTPYLGGASVTSVVVDPYFKDEKVVIFKYKNKTNYRKKTGHRQKYTRVKIEEIKHGS